MSIRAKVSLSISIAIAGLVVILYAVAHFLVLGKFEQIENRAIEADLKRVRNLIRQETDRLLVTAGDYAEWDDSYKFIQDRNAAYIDANMLDETLSGLDVNFMLFLDANGNPVYGKHVDFLGGEIRGGDVPAASIAAIRSNRNLVSHPNPEHTAKGLIKTSLGPVLVASSPILTSRVEGPVKGALVVGRYLDLRMVKHLSDLAQISFEILDYADKNLPSDCTEAIALLSSGKRWTIVPQSNETIGAYFSLSDMQGRPAMLVRYLAPREIYAQGRTTLSYMIVSLIAASLFFLLLANLLLDRQVVTRLIGLSAAVRDAAKVPGPDRSVPVAGNDELTGLAKDINAMLASLWRSGQDLRDSEERFRSLFREMSDLFALFEVVYDPSGDPEDFRLIEMNPACERIMLRSSTDMTGRSLKDLLSRANSEWMNVFMPVARGGKPQRFSFFDQFLGRHLEGSVYAPKDGFVAMTAADITEHVWAEKERESLESRIQETQKIESLGVLAGGIAHDFNNILMGILGNTDLALHETGIDPTAHRYLLEIDRASRHAANLCHQMLAYSGKGHFIVGATDLSRAVRESVSLIALSVSKRVTVKYDLPESLPPIQADETQIRQILINLVANASEAIGDRSGSITIRTGTKDCDQAYLERSCVAVEARPGKYVMLEISDTGCGMDPGARSKIFDPFFTTKFTGRGLGLAAVLGIVRGHNAAIQVCSEPDQGSVFRILFPVREAEIPRSEPKIEPISADSQEKGTVLLVDDEETVRRVTTDMLTRAGFKALAVADGLDAVQAFEEHKDEFALVLLDLTMPGMTVEETLERIRGLRPDIPVIVMSGFSEQELEDRFKEGDLDGFIQKPFLLSEFIATIRKALASSLHKKSVAS